MTTIDLLLAQPAVQAIGWALLQFVWQGAAVGLATAAALLALRRSAADVRYLVATIGLALMLTLPVVTAAQRYVSRSIQPAVASATTGAASNHAAALGAQTSTVTSASSTRSRSSSGIAAPTAPGSRSGQAWWAFTRSERLLPMLVLVWLAGVTILSVRLLAGWLWVRRMRTHGTLPVDPAWESLAQRLARRLHVSRAIALLESTLVDVPTVVGWLKPVVLLPVSAVGGLAPQQLEAILAHELAHIRRHDYAVNLMQTLVETLLFYHPAVWWLSRRIRVERENCCDDLAVALCGDPIAYANALADLESLRSSIPPYRKLDRAALAATGGSLVQRVRRLLGAPSHVPANPAWAAGTAALVFVAALAFGIDNVRAQQPQPQSPQTAAPASSSAVTVPDVDVEQALARERDAQRDVVRAQAQLVKLAAREAGALRDAARTAATPGATTDRQTQEAEVAMERARAMLADAQAGADKARQQVQTDALAEQQAELAHERAVIATVASSTDGALAAQARSAADSVAAEAAADGGQSISPHRDNSSGNWSWSNNGEKLEVTYSGTFDFTDDDTDVTNMSPGALFRISDGAWFGRHSVEIREKSGQIERRYYVNGAERPFEPEGRAWLRENMPKFVRNTGIAAPSRVAQLLKSGGAPAVLAEISRVDGTYVKGVYYRELFKQASLTPPQYRDVMAQAAREMRGSDYELGQLLIAVADKLPADDASRSAYFAAASQLSSAYETRRVYTEMLKRGPVDDRTLAGILDHVGTMNSDYDRSELLRAILAQQPLDDRTRAPFFKAASGLHGDYERHRVLGAALQRQSDAATVAAVVARAGDIGGDYERSMLLQEVLKAHGVDGSLRTPFFTAVNGLHSSYERGRVLQAVMRQPDVSDETLRAVLDSASGMSGYDLSRLLILVANTHTLSGLLRDAYVAAADKLSGYDQGQVMTALVRSERRR